MGVADQHATALFRVEERVCGATGFADVCARRFVARIFSEVSRSESAAQENVASVGLRGVGAAAAFVFGAFCASAAGEGLSFAGAGKRRVLAWGFWRDLRAPFAYGDLAEFDSCGDAGGSAYAGRLAAARGHAGLRCGWRPGVAVYGTGISSAAEAIGWRDGGGV